MELTPLADWLLRMLDLWSDAIADPRQFLKPAFHPDRPEVFKALEFFIAMMLTSLILTAPLALIEKGSFDEKIKVAANGIITLIFSLIIAVAWHYAFRIVGGESSFAGTYVAYAYSIAPYLPLISFGVWIVIAGLPARLRRYALNPLTQGEVMRAAQNDPETSSGMVFVGSIMMLAITYWSLIVMLRSLAFVHNVGGWAFAGAFILSIVFLIPITAVTKRISAMFHGGGLPPATSGAVWEIDTPRQ